MNKKLLILTLGTSIALTGCDSLLYGNTMAPIFSVNQPTAQTPPAMLNQTMVPIESSARDSVVVKQAQSNPYGSLPTRPNQVKNVSQQAQGGGTPVANPASNFNDPRIREASEVLAAEDTINNRVSSAVEKVENTPVRPNQAMVKRPVEAVKDNVTAQATETVNAAKEQVQTATATARETVNTAKATTTAAAAAATEAVRPAPTTTKSATRALLQEAKGAVSAGQYDKAASALERAHRIEPGNAKILYDIAQIRYAQGNYRQASSFASKAATYSNSPTLSKKVWSLLSNSRKKLGNNTGAAAAAQKAASFQ
ncbi:MAG: tetratricopeptide repeat protein [Gammaproteobacteria bacterium]|nr:tetratricopeptide repeat protein [Gammaproteobacteria bacterium]